MSAESADGSGHHSAILRAEEEEGEQSYLDQESTLGPLDEQTLADDTSESKLHIAIESQGDGSTREAVTINVDPPPSPDSILRSPSRTGSLIQSSDVSTPGLTSGSTTASTSDNCAAEEELLHLRHDEALMLLGNGKDGKRRFAIVLDSEREDIPLPDLFLEPNEVGHGQDEGHESSQIDKLKELPELPEFSYSYLRTSQAMFVPAPPSKDQPPSPTAVQRWDSSTSNASLPHAMEDGLQLTLKSGLSASRNDELGPVHGRSPAAQTHDAINSIPPLASQVPQIILSHIPSPRVLKCDACYLGLLDSVTVQFRRYCSKRCADSGEMVYPLVERAIIKGTSIPELLELRGQDAQTAMNIMQRTIDRCNTADDRSSIRRLMLKLSLRASKLPKSLFLEKVTCTEADNYAVGAFSDIFVGKYLGRPVALKRLRLFLAQHRAQKPQTNERFYYESLIWKNLRHDHVLTFLGVTNVVFPRSPCMVTPWMPFGHIRHALQDLRDSLTPIEVMLQVQKWIHQISLGLAYLHKERVVHGDLRGPNILIDENRCVRLSDFGLAVLAEATSHNYASMRGGNVRWAAPELIHPERYHLKTTRPTYASDVFSFGCVIVELYLGEAPYAGLSDYQVIAGLLGGLRPLRPSRRDGIEIADTLWNITTDCFKDSPQDRPDAQTLSEMIEGSFGRSLPPLPQEDKHANNIYYEKKGFARRIRDALSYAFAFAGPLFYHKLFKRAAGRR
ncbi:hypothetical protein EIP91_008398 [Steccherinum ochraceum]|uniref:Protein kinase domain-containing protein n=1 Tax=Steccherinum ochraceum TaxID=92696 RepID=A0A4R0R5M2_9APHY|nr:hypothetical protein EIP91_008398 [Steccherinum ochraceum]